MLALLEVFEGDELRRIREVLPRTWDLAAWRLFAIFSPLPDN